MTSLFRTERLTNPQGQIEIYLGGTGTPVTYLHGMIGNPRAHPFLERLGAAHHVTAPCLPGFNESTPREEFGSIYEWVAATSALLSLSGAVGRPAVASSIGAMLALELAAVRPEAFSALVLLSPLGLWDDSHPIEDVFSERTPLQSALLLRDPARADMFFKNDPTMPPESIGDQELARYRTRRSAASLVWPIPYHGFADRAHQVTCPVYIVWGADDALVGPYYRRLYAETLPRLVGSEVVANAGHLLEWDQPEQACAAVLRGLQKTGA